MITQFTDPVQYGDFGTWLKSVATLRQEGPLHRVEVEGFDPFWVAIGYDTVVEIERQPDLFHNAPQPILTNQEGIRLQSESGVQPRTLIQMDAPDHPRYRRFGYEWFRPANLDRLQPRLDELAEHVVERMRQHGGRCDFAADIALHYPLRVILEILGLPESDYPLMLKLTQDYFGSEDPSIARNGDVSRAGEVQILQDLFDYLHALTADRRARPTDDLAGAIAAGTIDGEPFPPLETASYHMIIATAGHETTSKAIAGGMWALIEHPAQRRLLTEQPQLIPGAVEEMLRYVSPVRHMMRTATADTRIAGQKIAAGDWILLSYPAANYDPARFDDPMAFDVLRANASSQLSFGYGRHFCLGAQLARMEIRTLFRHLLPRLHEIDFDGEPVMTRATFVGGPKWLPIRYVLEA
ncbi:cytochrome P450 [Streptosporangium sp. NPDC051022]|uniref:cytochrome P450 n=1 Tax=Streptosporangium sp. NPDC051022 TaxID=3155752 RepID=UPI0034149432